MPEYLVIYQGAREPQVKRTCSVSAPDEATARVKADVWFGTDRDLVFERIVPDTPTERFIANSGGRPG